MKALMLRQKDTTMYLTVVRAEDLIKKAKVDRWSEKKPKGYQRVPDERRFAPELSRSALRYLKEEEGVFPTSILVNVRSELKFKQDGKVDGGGLEGELEVPSGETWWILDGQHRLEALERMTAEDSSFKDYPVPVTIFNFTKTDLYDEMRQFYIHNSRTRTVPVDLAWRILQRMYEKLGRVELIKREGTQSLRSAQALQIAEKLRKDDISPWKDTIVVPGIPKTPEQFLPERTLVRSLMEVVKETTLAALGPDKLTSLLIDYWNAIKALFPEAGKNPHEYTLLRSTGVIAFHIVFPAVYAQCTLKSDFSKEAMQSVLGRITKQPGRRVPTPIGDETWNTRTGHGLAVGTSMKTIKMLAEDFIETITTTQLSP